MEINLSQDSIVDQRTGEVSAPSEYVENLRGIESDIQHADDRIAALKVDLKHARDGRENLVDRLRAAVRDGKVLPLLELAEADAAVAESEPHDDDTDGLDVQGEDDLA